MAEVHEIADGIFRIATFIPEANITFNQFLDRGREAAPVSHRAAAAFSTDA